MRYCNFFFILVNGKSGRKINATNGTKTIVSLPRFFCCRGRCFEYTCFQGHEKVQ